MEDLIKRIEESKELFYKYHSHSDPRDYAEPEEVEVYWVTEEDSTSV